MKHKHIEFIEERVAREFLPFVNKPSRYIGGEINQIKKDLTKTDLNVALCFPDVYEIGMSNMGIAIVYDILNRFDGIAAERVFAPGIDAEKILRDKNIPLFTLESKAALFGFDVIGFSITNELCYTNVLNILDLAGLKVRSRDRDENNPIVIAGGGMANCCEPIAPFIDLFVLGEVEEIIIDLIKVIGEYKKKDKYNLLRTAANTFDCVYAPSLYKFDGPASLKPKHSDICLQRTNAVVRDFEDAPALTKPIVPFSEAVHERVSVEIMRGCPGRCRFCQASFCRRPIRFRSVDKIFDIAKTSFHNTGFDTVSLLSLSTADYPKLEPLVDKLNGYFKNKHVGLSLPSLRVDQQLKLIPKLATSVRKSGLTIAVEAASEKVRQIINKPLTNENLFAAVQSAYEAGWHTIKLYFMAGLPGETQEDIKEIVNLSYQLAKLRKNVDGKTGQINAAVSWFVPKPHTPFAWINQMPRSYFENAKQMILDEKKRLRAKFLHFKFHHIERSILESAIGRGDRQLADAIEAAWKKGAVFDLWDDYFNYELWRQAFEENGLDPEQLAQKQFTREEMLPWEHLGGPGKSYLLKHLDDATEKMNA